MKLILIISTIVLFYSCGVKELPKPSMEKDLNVGDFLILDTIGDSVFFNPNKKRIRKIKYSDTVKLKTFLDNKIINENPTTFYSDVYKKVNIKKSK